MSRVGKKPIEIPAGVEAKLETGKITVKGPLGEISQDVNPKLTIKKENNTLMVERPSDQKTIPGTARSDQKPDRQHGDGCQQGI